MAKKDEGKLRLEIETIRDLTPEEATRVNGGGGAPILLSGAHSSGCPNMLVTLADA